MGVGFVIADALKSGWQVATLLSEHLPFDLVIISPDMRLFRLSVKYSTAKDGVVPVRYKSAWNDRRGTHRKVADLAEFDATATYCPNTGEVYYLRNDEIDGKGGEVRLRLTPPKNGQRKGVRMAPAFIGISRLL
jgi:hypothetical protein